MRVDLHVHTRESHSAPEHWLAELLGVQQSYSQPEAVLSEALRKGLDAVAITNHDSAEDALRMAREHPDGVIPGCEYTVYGGHGRYAHVVVLGIDEKGHEGLLREKHRGIARFTDLARRGGYAYFLAHPAWEVGPEKGRIDPNALCGWLEHFDVIETSNSQSAAENEIARSLAKYFRKAGVGGSDSHDVPSIGTTWTESPAGAIEGFMDDVRDGNVRAGGTPASYRGFAATVREVLAAFYRREFLKASRRNTGGGREARPGLGGLIRTALEVLMLPGFLWAPQLGSRDYFRRLGRRAEGLRRRLIGHLELDLARSVARGSYDNEERSRRWIAGMREIRSAFGRC